MATGIVDKIRAAARERQRGALGDYFRLVREAAEERSVDGPDPERVLDVCERAGKTADDFQSDMLTLQKRIEASRRLPEAAEMERQRDALNAEIVERKNAHVKAHIEHMQTISALHEKASTLSTQAGCIRSEHHQVFRSCPYVEIEQALTEVLARRRKLIDRQTYLLERIRNGELMAERDQRGRAEGRGGIAHLEQHLAPLDGYRAELDEVRSLLRESDDELAAIEAEKSKP